jgi:hypothetical protein
MPRAADHLAALGHHRIIHVSRIGVSMSAEAG